MNEEMVQQLMTTAERLANAAESLDRVLGRLDAQQEALTRKWTGLWRRWKSSRRMRWRRAAKGRGICRSGWPSWKSRTPT